MQGLIENLPIVVMLLLAHWPIVAIALALPVAGVVVSVRRGGCTDARRRRVAAIAFLGMLPVVGLCVFLLFGGGLGDLRYWLDWMFYAAIVLGGAAYVALLAGLFARPALGNPPR